MDLESKIIDLLQKTATQMPTDVLAALKTAQKQETGPARAILENLLTNCQQARAVQKPICQDTGTPIFYVEHAPGRSQKELERLIARALNRATRQIPLRPNAVNSLTGQNLGNRPQIHFQERPFRSRSPLKISLLLKGGGSENVSATYQLPNEGLKAERDLAGVRHCVLDAIHKAQGKGCPPYIIGVALGGNIEQVAHLAKQQLLRPLSDKNPEPELRKFETQTLRAVNQLGIGPLGLGGKTTALAVKAAAAPRHPASFFVGISLSCWCLRRQISRLTKP